MLRTCLQTRPITVSAAILMAALFALTQSPVGSAQSKMSGIMPASQSTQVTAPHLTAQLVDEESAIYAPDVINAGLYFTLEPGWHVYWTNAGDSGEPPTIQWTLPKGITADAMQFPAPKRLPLGPLMDFGYEDDVLFPIALHADGSLNPGTVAHLTAKVNWLVCREVCLPGKATLQMNLPVVAAKPAGNGSVITLYQKFESQIPAPLPASDTATFQQSPQGFALDISTGAKQSGAQFFPLDETVIANAAPQPSTPTATGVELTLKKDENLQAKPQALNGVIELADGSAYVIHATPGAVAASHPTGSAGGQNGLGKAALFAFLGGIILNLMPCVFPVLFIKGLALVQSSQQERRQLRAHGWVYTLGILVSFWAVVAVLLALRAAGRQLGWGFQFQSPIFLAVMAMLLFFLGLALAGQFEIGLSLTSAGGSLAQKHGYAGSFFTGVLAMVVATPCTAPLMGAAIGYALAHSALVSFAVFTALGFGLAAPYLLLSYNPAWTRLLPKPGAWMEILKQAVAVPIFGTVIWLVWVFAQIAGTNAMMGLLAAFLLLAIAGWVLGRWPGKTSAASVAILVLIIAIVVPVWAVRAFGSVGQPQANVAAATGDAVWQPYSPDLIAKERAAGHAVFVDFTASWCLSCQVNERIILDSDDVKQHFRDTGLTLVRADWTNQDADITKALAALGRSGVPTYAIYPADPNADPQVLPEVLTKGIVIDALNSLPKPQRQSAALPRPISQ
jgi:thiol:disulfide interchange protein DsbD